MWNNLANAYPKNGPGIIFIIPQITRRCTILSIEPETKTGMKSIVGYTF